MRLGRARAPPLQAEVRPANRGGRRGTCRRDPGGVPRPGDGDRGREPDVGRGDRRPPPAGPARRRAGGDRAAVACGRSGGHRPASGGAGHGNHCRRGGGWPGSGVPHRRRERSVGLRTETQPRWRADGDPACGGHRCGGRAGPVWRHDAGNIGRHRGVRASMPPCRTCAWAASCSARCACPETWLQSLCSCRMACSPFPSGRGWAWCWTRTGSPTWRVGASRQPPVWHLPLDPVHLHCLAHPHRVRDGHNSRAASGVGPARGRRACRVHAGAAGPGGPHRVAAGAVLHWHLHGRCDAYAGRGYGRSTPACAGAFGTLSSQLAAARPSGLARPSRSGRP